jgi:predicted  nucleic acid-binding Zn-ribbon protein
MREMSKPQFRYLLISFILLLAFISAKGQTAMPEVLYKNSIKEQLNYIEEKTRIYENYRAIREDMFQKLKGNISDTLSSAISKIAVLKNTTSKLNLTIDSLKARYETTNTNLENVTRSKNSIKVLGIEVNKQSYNTFMWTIVAGLIAVLALGFLVFRRNMTITHNTKKELQDLKNEFEAYRKTTREAREKMSMAHFLELQKLKGEK